MAIFGLCLVLITILYFIDKNQQWRAVWRIVRTTALVSVILAAVTAIGYGGYYLYQRHKEAKLATETKQDDSIDLSAGLVLKPTPQNVPIPEGATIGTGKDHDALAQQSGWVPIYTLRDTAKKYGALPPLPKGYTFADGVKPWKLAIDQEEYAFEDRAHLDAFVHAVGLKQK